MSEHPNLAAALVAALAELTVVEKGRTANAGSYSYDYADLGDIVKKTRPTLADHGVVALTPVVDNADQLQVTVVLLHTSGDRLDFGPFSFPHGRDAQATGSMVTYHRRYALSAALGIAAGDDDDGATAHARQEPSTQACRVCGEMVPSSPGNPEPLRAHMVTEHDWTRLDDGKVAPPAKESPAREAGGEQATTHQPVEAEPSSSAPAPLPALDAIQAAFDVPPEAMEPADPEIVGRLVARMNALVGQNGIDCWKVFTNSFGTPEQLTTADLDEAKSHVAEFEERAKPSSAARRALQNAGKK